MKTIIWKELRENLKWAALAFFCLLLAEIFTLTSYRHVTYFNYGAVTLCGDPFLLVSAFGCSAIGAVLGALQILPELRRDQWASLLHRPIHRHTILLGKVAAGLVLYGLATGLPLLASVLCVALPGHFAAPFAPGLASPAASDLPLGMVFYFTAILVGLHSGRWFGSRAAIALGPVAVLMIHLAGTWPFALPLAASVVLFVAAWDAMLGSIAARPWPLRLPLGLVILVGVGTGLLLIVAPFRADDPQRLLSVDAAAGFDIAPDGTVVSWKRVGEDKFLHTDEQGNVLPEDRYSDNNSASNNLYFYPFANRQSAKARPFIYKPRSSLGSVELVAGANGGPEVWYRIAGRRQYFVGYDTLSARCIGFCDADGFKSPGATLHPFAGEPQFERNQAIPILFWIGSQVFAVDFTERRLVTLLDAKGETVHGVARFPSNFDPSRIAVALASTIRILDFNGAQIASLPYGYDRDPSPHVGISATDNFTRTFLQYTPELSVILQNRGAVDHLDVFDAHYQRVATYTKPEYMIVTAPAWGDRIADFLTTPLPALAGASLLHRDLDKAPYEFGAKILRDSDRPAFYAASGMAILLSVTACLWARRSGLSTKRTVLWMLLTILFGLPGFLAYRLSTHWPALVRCPRCAQRRPVTTTSCPHCHEAWQPLPPTGAEIFDPA